MTLERTTIDYRDWDWLPDAAVEIRDYLTRLLTEGSITAHAVQSRSKSIASFQEKCERKGYDDPRRQLTDAVAVRLIMYSDTDKDRAAELVRERFVCREDFNPGQQKAGTSRQGYDCAHLVVTGEQHGQSRGWLVAGGALARYFDRFGGLEIQIRTVASHAWAEFEHARRYKGAGYDAIGEEDRRRIDAFFCEAAELRRRLDETFVQIERALADPTGPARAAGTGAVPAGGPADEESAEVAADAADVDGEEAPDHAADEAAEAITAPALAAFLARRFPEDAAGSEKGLAFACELLAACGIASMRQLAQELALIDGQEVRRLMETTTTVTRVRRLDDELLAVYGEDYIRATQDAGSYGRRADQLRWRYDRLRKKVTVRPRPVTYQLLGADCPEPLARRQMPAARVVRELARILAEHRGIEAVQREGRISAREDLDASVRARPVRLQDGTELWVATALSRRDAQALMESLLAGSGLDLRVMRNGEAFLVGA